MIDERNTVINDDTATATTRKLLVIGCGDGGCNIASEIVKAIPDEAVVIAYNTSTRAMEYQSHNVKIFPTQMDSSGKIRSMDGSGKIRSDATNVFKTITGRKFMEKTMELVTRMDRLDYILVVGTADGGTGSGTVPTMAKLLSTNLGVPVIIMGVYPSITEDAMSQYNAVQWQDDVTKTGLPYIILDNNHSGNLTEVHAQVNEYAVRIAKLLAGKTYGNTDISIIDGRNLYMLIQQMGGRIVIASEEGRINSQDTLSDHIKNQLLANDFQPEPSWLKGIGLFVKGPKEMIDRIDSTLPELQAAYGQPVLKFSHLEITDGEPCVSILISGCTEPGARLKQMQNKYDDIINGSKNAKNVAQDMASTMVNPVGEMNIPGGRKPGSSIDFSALDL